MGSGARERREREEAIRILQGGEPYGLGDAIGEIVGLIIILIVTACFLH